MQAITPLAVQARHLSVSVDNGREALEKWQGEDFDLILSELQMPYMSGSELVTEIRRKEQ